MQCVLFVACSDVCDTCLLLCVYVSCVYVDVRMLLYVCCVMVVVDSVLCV